MDCKPAGRLCLWDFPGNDPGVGCRFLLQGIFPTQGWSTYLVHWQEDSLLLSRQGSPVTWIRATLMRAALMTSSYFDDIRADSISE